MICSPPQKVLHQHPQINTCRCMIINVYVYVIILVYIYIYIKRERERDIDMRKSFSHQMSRFVWGSMLNFQGAD